MSSKQFTSKLQELLILTSKYIKLSGKEQSILNLDELLEGYLKNNYDRSNVLFNNCASKFANFASFHKTKGKIIFPDFETATKKVTSAQIQAGLPTNINYFKLYDIIEGSRKFDLTGCYDSLTIPQKYQYNYVVKRRRDFLDEELNVLLNNDYSKEKAELIIEVLNCYKLVQSDFDSFPQNIQNIIDDKNYEKTLLLSEKEVLNLVANAIRNEGQTVSGIHALLVFKPYRRIQSEIPVTTRAPFEEAINTLRFLYSQREFIQKIKDKKPAPERVSLKANELLKLLDVIKILEKSINENESYDEYESAKKESQLAVSKWYIFLDKYNELNFGAYNAREVKGTRFEGFFKEINDYYNNSNVALKRHQTNISTNYNSLGVIEKYKKQSYKTWANFKSSYLIGNPTVQNQKDINILIEKLDLVIAVVEKNPTLKNSSSLKNKNLAEERKKWLERKEEVDALMKQVDIWNANVKKVDGAYQLEPQTFKEIKPKLAKTKKVNIATAGTGDEKNKTAPSDVDQGSVGDCYFLASVASMATDKDFFYGKDDSVIQIVHPEYKKGRNVGKLNPKKIQYFSVRMYLPIDIEGNDMKDEQTGRTPVNILVYPSKSLIGKTSLEYAQKADSGELWVAILEKAFAEIRGGYNNIEGGFPEEGFALLMNKSANDFTRINFDDKAALQELKISLSDESMSITDAISKKLTESVGSHKITLSTPSVTELIASGAVASNDTSDSSDASVQVYINNKAPNPPDIILFGEHAYSIQGESNGTFTILNPHGGQDVEYDKKTVFKLTGAQIVQYFESVTIL